jgi:hypothetical protein
MYIYVLCPIEEEAGLLMLCMSNECCDGRNGHGERGKLKGKGVVIGQLVLSKGPARMGICYHGQRANIPSDFFSYNKYVAKVS